MQGEPGENKHDIQMCDQKVKVNKPFDLFPCQGCFLKPVVPVYKVDSCPTIDYQVFTERQDLAWNTAHKQTKNV